MVAPTECGVGKAWHSSDKEPATKGLQTPIFILSFRINHTLFRTSNAMNWERSLEWNRETNNLLRQIIDH